MRILVFQHIACEHPGIFRDFLQSDGIAWDAIELDEGQPIPALDRYDALWVMGGPMDVWEEAAHPWLVAEKAAIRRFVCELDRPFLGVCLGHQLLASALGSPDLMRASCINPWCSCAARSSSLRLTRKVHSVLRSRAASSAGPGGT